MTTEPLLRIEDLHVEADGAPILRGVSLEVGPGEVHTLMGPNGSGKSTLANALLANPAFNPDAAAFDLTRGGEKLVRKLLPAMWRHYAQLCRDLSATEMSTIERSMKKLLADLELRPRRPASAELRPAPVGTRAATARSKAPR